MPKLIADLAIMLLTAAIVAVIFRKIKQPLVLGYILAGFLVGPYMPYFFTVADSHSIETWGEIGIIILMFSLGLEFNLHKLISVGRTAVVTAFVEIFGMLVVGYFLGQALGWGMMDSIFLGGMLSMSSTTIIIKAFEELAVPKKGFASLVFGILVIQDIAGIFMMIILATVSVSQNISGGALAVQLLEMVLYLVIWLIVGIFVLPTILRKTSKFMSDEVLLLMSLGICFGMVLLADTLGFSTALGAFMAGSLMAGTVFAERVEHLSMGIKDLFGAVFFLSVGMMIDPAMLVKYIVPIIIITLVTILSKLIISVLGVVLSGESLEDSVRSGCSLAQIGEFAFMIASLGMSLGVIQDYVYPIIVTVSVMTTLTTPFFIKNADNVEGLIEKIVPNGLLDKIRSNAEGEKVLSGEQSNRDWSNYLRRYVKRTALFGSLMAGVALITQLLIYPAITAALSPLPAKIISVAILAVGIGIFVRPMLDMRSTEFTTLWVSGSANKVPLSTLTLVRFMVIVFLAFLPMQSILGIPGVLLLAIIIIAIAIIYKTGWLASAYLTAETRFITNLNERSLENVREEVIDWLDEKLFVDYIDFCGTDCSGIAGKMLMELNWGKIFKINVFKVVRGKEHIVMPDGDFVLDANDVIYFLGQAENIRAFHMSLDHEDVKLINAPIIAPSPEEGEGAQEAKASNRVKVGNRELMNLKEYIASQEGEEGNVYDYALPINKDSHLQGKTIKESGIRETYGCMVIGLMRNKLPILQPDNNLIIQYEDLVWILGSKKMALKLMLEE